MSDNYRYATLFKKSFPKPKRTIPLYGEGEDEGKYFRCWYCGQINNAEKRPLAEGENPLNIPVNADNMSLWLQSEGTNGATTITDSGPTKHTVTVGGNAQISTSRAKHGNSSLYLDGTSGTFLTIADHADFNLSGGNFSISCWVNYADTDITSLGQTIYYQQTDSSANAVHFYLYDLNNYRVEFRITESDSAVLRLRANLSRFYTNNWNHVEVSENGNDYYLFVNGKMAEHVNSSSRCANYTGVVYIGATVNLLRFKGYIDDLVVRKQAWHTRDFHPSKVDCYYPDPSSGCLFCGSPNYR